MQNNTPYSDFIKSFSLGGLLLSFIFTLLHLFQKSDPENRVLGNYSLILILLIFLFGLFLVFFTTIFAKIHKNHFPTEKIRVLIDHQITKLLVSLMTIGSLLFFAVSFPLIRFFGFSLLQAILNRFAYLILYWALLSFWFVFLEKKFLTSNTLKSALTFVSSRIRRLMGWIKQQAQKPIPGTGYFVILLLVVSYFYLHFPITIHAPIGSAGLYALMAELIQHNHFAIPQTVPYYGPGGIPFAYPPLGFYFMAFFTGPAGIPEMEYLRWAPAIFSILAMSALFLFVKESTEIKTAFLSVLFVFTSPRLFLFHGEAAGIIRGFAFVFLLFGLYFLSKYTKAQKFRDLFLGGIFFTLVTLTHLSYAVFFAISTFLILMFSKLPLKKKILGVGFVALAGILFSAPWWITILKRYGVEVFMNALQSHNNISFLSTISNPGKFISDSWIEFNRYLSTTPVIIGLSICGLFILLNQKTPLFPFLFLASFFISEGDRYQVTIASVLAAASIVFIINHTKSGGILWKRVSWTFFILILLWINAAPSINKINRTNTVAVNQPFLQLTTWFKTNAEPRQTYLFLSPNTQMAEWMPYLSESTPAVGTWGGEWIGTYADQFSHLTEIIACGNQLTPACIQEMDSKYPSDYLVLEISNPEETFTLPNRNLLFESDSYLVFK